MGRRGTLSQRVIGIVNISVFCLIFIYALEVFADSTEPAEPAESSGYWSLQLENDGWVENDDQYYTSGIEVSYMLACEPPPWLRGLADLFPFYERTSESGVIYSLGQTIFTPEDIREKELIKNDRPYAGWLYGSAAIASRVKLKDNYQYINGLEVTLGIVGPGSHADDVQDGFHRFLGTSRPEGWDNQLEDELGFVMTYSRKWNYYPKNSGFLDYEISPHAVAALGNVYTYAGGGLTFRWGTKLREDIGPPTIRPGFPGVPYFRPDPQPNWYFFAGLEGRAVARNIFLDGNTFEDSHSVDKNIFVGDVQFGFAFHIKNVRIAISNIMRSEEFDGQDGYTDYGAINISFYL
jgi:hypothetical protein